MSGKRSLVFGSLGLMCSVAWCVVFGGQMQRQGGGEGVARVTKSGLFPKNAASAFVKEAPPLALAWLPH